MLAISRERVGWVDYEITVVVTNCGYRGNYELWLLWCCFKGPSTQQFFSSSSDVIATTCFGHTTIIKRHSSILS
jgi:hypothetical protein